MIKPLLKSISLLALMILFFTGVSKAASCHPYIEQLSNGDVKFSVSFATQQAYVEVFVKKNGNQIIANNITSSVQNANGTFTYSYTALATNFATNDELLARFYSYEAGKPAVFTPGPYEGVWSTPFIYGSSCKGGDDKTSTCHTYVQQLSNGDLKYFVSFAKQQAYVEVFVKKNGLQIVAANIFGSGVQNADGSYTYSYTSSASNFVNGDVITVRFYSYEAAKPAVFTPGPSEGVWSDTFTYGQKCETETAAIFVSVNGDDDAEGTVTAPVQTIARAILLAKLNGVKEVKVSTGEYIESQLNPGSGMSILGGYSPDFASRDLTHTTYRTVINGGNYGSVFYLRGNKNVLIEGFRITNGNAQFNTYSGFSGGGIYANDCENVEIRKNVIDNNRAGNVYSYWSKLIIHDNQIINGISSGTGADFYNIAGYGLTTLTYSEVYNNLFTRPTSVFQSLPAANFYGNTYLFAARMGAEEQAASSEMQITVANDLLHIEGNEGNVNVKIVDLSGKTSITAQGNDINIAALEQGIYIIYVQDGATVTSKKVFVE